MTCIHTLYILHILVFILYLHIPHLYIYSKYAYRRCIRAEPGAADRAQGPDQGEQPPEHLKHYGRGV